MHIPPQITDILKTATKPPIPQSIVQPRVAVEPPSIQHTLPAGNTNQQTFSAPKPIPRVQTSIPQPYAVISDKPILPAWSSDKNKAISKVSLPMVPDLVQKNTTKQRRCSRMSK